MVGMKDSGGYGVESTFGGGRIRVYVAARASANKVVGAHNGALKVALTAPPVEGAANRALVEFLAKMLEVPKSAVTLLAGHTSRNKVVGISGISREHALRRLVPSGSEKDA